MKNPSPDKEKSATSRQKPKSRRKTAGSDDPKSRQALFIKSWNELLKQASDYCLLSDETLAIVAFSPDGDPLVFGRPCADEVIGRFISGDKAGGGSSSGLKSEVADPDGSGLDFGKVEEDTRVEQVRAPAVEVSVGKKRGFGADAPE